jgi:hypothetical protein
MDLERLRFYEILLEMILCWNACLEGINHLDVCRMCKVGPGIHVMVAQVSFLFKQAKVAMQQASPMYGHL